MGGADGRERDELHDDRDEGAEAADGFWISPDVYHDGVDAVVDEVVPILRERGLYPDGYGGAILRDHPGIPDQHGLDPRVTGATKA